ncbi:hypothetical protein HN681_05175 [archaeon]|jgi:hypothetical protein|nr:hypothetical protein [archaeon]MBT3731136.1 hypothetical protein [archaeon]MBT4669709.1 hypothetical protein [archaeon]MBT5030462.1 hypothetical protein [archaeon]MBT5287437.1 hypothetical protein [archaeon]
MEDEDPAKGELKRIDHLVFVTLKYTRTVDVIRTIIEKFIAALDFKIEDYYNHLFENGKVARIHPVALVRAKNLEKELPKDKTVKDIVDFYVHLKKVYNAEYRAKEEYRKNVTLVTHEEDINIPRLKEYSELLKDYIIYFEELKS